VTNDELAELFKANGYEWSYKGGEKRTPTAEELSILIGQAKVELNGDPEATQIEVGRLVIKKNGNYIDVFVHAQEFRRDGL
jgi:hypothetical protein